MSPAERQLRRKLAGLRTSRTFTRMALESSGDYRGRQKAKLKMLKAKMSRIQSELEAFKEKKPNYVPPNLLLDIPCPLPKELIQDLLGTPEFRIERIVSQGHSLKKGFWYDQPTNEWILLVSGAARLRFEGEEPFTMTAGSYVNIPAGQRHRVEWTDPKQITVWLAIHYRQTPP